MVTFRLSVPDGLTATVSADGSPHPDLLDMLAERCVRLFVKANESLIDEGDDGD